MNLKTEFQVHFRYVRYDRYRFKECLKFIREGCREVQKFKLANVLLEDNPHALSYPTLYHRSTAPVIFEGDESAWEMRGPGIFDYTTYFNSLSVAKWKRYTVARKFYLHLELKGAACTITQTKASTYSWSSELLASTVLQKEESPDWQSLDFELVVDSDAVLMGFSIESSGNVFIRDSYYYAVVETSRVRTVELALATTTFKKEDFIEPNIAMIKEDILSGDDLIANHFHMHVVDNGRTLDAERLSGDGVTVYPNDNVGGAGGFARGMIEAMRQRPPATNVLLMDDDVSISPESIKRTFNLLSLLSPEYTKAFISGAMLNYEIGEDQWEDLGFMTKGGFCHPIKGPLRMSLLHDIILNEEVEPTEEQHQTYAAWWYCCIPIETIRSEGLPLPLFVRYDDAEYGLRCKPRFITMNSICVWHLSFHSRYNAAVERYQTTRNGFIAQATTGMAPESDFLLEMHNSLQVELKKFNYINAELILDGFEDFLKGPDFIAQPVAEERFMAANRNAEKLIPFEELRKETSAIEDFDLDEITCEEIYKDEARSRGEALIDFLTYNGQRMALSSKGGDDVAVIPAAGWVYPAGKIRRKTTLVAIDPINRKGVVRRLDRTRFNAVMSRYKKALTYYRHNKKRLESEYTSAREKLTSVEFWKGYLGID